MKKVKNIKGFALVETLIGAIFVVVLFVMIFENYFPFIAKYEQYENYDDLDSKYIAHYLREMITVDPLKDNIFAKLSGREYVILMIMEWLKMMTLLILHLMNYVLC